MSRVGGVCPVLVGFVVGGPLFAGSASGADGVGSVEAPIIGGNATDPGEYPATGALVRGRSFRCTATLIAPDVAITAAHCLSEEGWGDFQFTLDADLTDDLDDLIPVALYHKHPEFEEWGEGDELTRIAKRNDVAVFILDRPIEDTPVEKLEASSDITYLNSGAELTVVGYGRDQWAVPSTAGVKRDGVLFVDRVTTWELQSMDEDPQPCKGDSGGPLFVQTAGGRHITGLVSRAFGDSAQCDSGAIFTHVAPYTDWIAEASLDRDTGCSVAGGRGSIWPMLLAWLLFALRPRTCRGAMGLARRR